MHKEIGSRARVAHNYKTIREGKCKMRTQLKRSWPRKCSSRPQRTARSRKMEGRAKQTCRENHARTWGMSWDAGPQHKMQGQFRISGEFHSTFFFSCFYFTWFRRC
ncbi:hypothetical protein I3843_06G048500 [Carya illinoinensis]|nr:hypothetical protein I3843_06G048500 [Carya illinoinensis]